MVLNFLQFYTLYCTVDICRYENLESLGKCFVPFVRMHLPSAFKGNTWLGKHFPKDCKFLYLQISTVMLKS